MRVCILFLPEFAGSFTFLGLVWRGVIWGVRGSRRSDLSRIRLGKRGAGCTGPGIWCAGAAMGFWSLSGARMRR